MSPRARRTGPAYALFPGRLMTLQPATVAQFVDTAGLIPAPPPARIPEEGIRTVVDAPYYQRVPIPCGKVRYTARLIGRTALSSSTEFRLFTFGKGPCTMTDLREGETLIAAGPLLSTDAKKTASDFGITYEAREGAASEPDLTLVDVVLDNRNPNAALTNGGSGATTTSKPTATQFSIGITATKGSVRTLKGKLVTVNLVFRADYRLKGATTWILGTNYTASFLSAGSATIGGPVVNSGTPLPSGEYEIRVVYVSADYDPTGIVWTYFWSAGGKASPAGIAIVALTCASSKPVQQLNAIVEPRILDWTGSTWTVRETRNPASILRYLLQAARGSAALADARLDLTALQTWHAENVTAGRTCDYAFDDDRTLFDALRLVASTGRAGLAIKDGIYSVVRDALQTTPRQLFTPDNSWGFSAQRQFLDIPHAIRARFLNSTLGYQWDELVVYDDGYNLDGTGGKTAATKFETQTFEGVICPTTGIDNLYRQARYRLFVAHLRPEVFGLSTDFEHLSCTRGDMVRVAHWTTLWGTAAGKIVRVIDATHLWVDKVLTLPAGTWKIRVRTSTGGDVLATVTAAAALDDPYGGRTALTLSGAVTVAAGDLFAYGESGLETVTCLVQAIEPGPDLSARLTLVEQADDLYAVDTDASSTIPAFSSKITAPSAPVLGTPSVNGIAAKGKVVLSFGASS